MAYPELPQLEPFLRLMHDLADVSAVEISPYFRQKIVVDVKKGKGIYDPVTDADRKAEQVIRDYLAQNVPDHAIIGEEFQSLQTSSKFCWIIDPIDGTRAFIMGSPLWGTLIGLCHDGLPVLGMMNQPFTGERYWAGPETAMGRWSGFEGPLSTSDTFTLKDAVITSTCPDLFANQDDFLTFERLRGHCRMTRYGGDCYGYCLLATGGVDLVVESGLAAYDILPLVPIVKSAGGVITDWEGDPISLEDTKTGKRQVIASANIRLHEAALKVLSRP